MEIAVVSFPYPERLLVPILLEIWGGRTRLPVRGRARKVDTLENPGKSWHVAHNGKPVERRTELWTPLDAFVAPSPLLILEFKSVVNQ